MNPPKKKKSTLTTYPRIWRVVARIPQGKVASYGTVSRLAGFPSQPRVAGYALHNLPPGIDIPWQRVVNSQGRISLRGDSGKEQRRLLEQEGIRFIRNRIDMKVFGWKQSGHHRRKVRKP
jgi:methylated-DNA-protein-cysteine methyltransferase related protein